MSQVVVVARLLLASVLAVAAVGKLRRPGAFRGAVVDFGVPARAAPLVAWALIGGEAAAAAMLVADGTARAGAVVALGLVAAFSTSIGLNLRRGRRPECQCFGQFHSSPIGMPALVRNAILASLAVVVAIGPPAGVGDITGAMPGPAPAPAQSPPPP